MGQRAVDRTLPGVALGGDCYWPRAFLHVEFADAAGATAARRAPGWAALTPAIEWSGACGLILDVTHSQRQGTPEQLARRAQGLAQVASGGTCSVGVAGTRLVARYAAGLAGPGAVVVIAPWQARECLRAVPVTRLCRIGPPIAAWLAGYGARDCGEVAALPAELLSRRFGIVGRQLWLACLGRDPELAAADITPAAALVERRVCPPRTTSARTIDNYLRHLCDKVAARLRRLDLRAGGLRVGARLVPSARSFEAVLALASDPPRGPEIFQAARRLLHDRWRGEAVAQLEVAGVQLANASGQLELFAAAEIGTLQRSAGIEPGAPDVPVAGRSVPVAERCVRGGRNRHPAAVGGYRAGRT